MIQRTTGFGLVMAGMLFCVSFSTADDKAPKKQLDAVQPRTPAALRSIDWKGVENKAKSDEVSRAIPQEKLRQIPASGPLTPTSLESILRRMGYEIEKEEESGIIFITHSGWYVGFVVDSQNEEIIMFSNLGVLADAQNTPAPILLQLLHYGSSSGYFKIWPDNKLLQLHHILSNRGEITAITLRKLLDGHSTLVKYAFFDIGINEWVKQ